MQKSRELYFERGTLGGLFYTNSSVVYDFQPAFAEKSDLYLQFQLGVDAAVTYKAVPSWIGTQKFSSTELPRPQFNNCNNYKVRGVELPITYCNQAYNRPNYYYCAPFMRLGVPTGFTGSQATPQNPNSYWVHVDDAQRRAWWSMQPRFEGEFQALNFLYELKDFKDIAKGIMKINPKRVLDNVKSLKRKLAYAQKQVAQGSLAKNVLTTASAATKTMAEVHLTKQFAVDPTVRDLTTLHGQLVTLVNQVQQEFFDRGQDKQTSHYSETVEETSSLLLGATNNYWKLTGSRSSVVFTATMEYRYEYEMRSWFDALKRYYGLNVNALVVWNALPFSFVLDYFYKVGQAIDFMNVDPNVELRLMQYCESLLVKATAGTHYADDPRASVLIDGGSGLKEGQVRPITGELIAGYEGTWYIRRVTTPNKGMATPRLSLPSAKQMTNLVALVRALW